MATPSPQDRLAQMAALMPWQELAALTQGHDESGALTAMARLLRLHIAQRLYALSDDEMRAALRESQALRSFAGLDDELRELPDAAARADFQRLLRTEPLAFGALSRLGEPTAAARAPASKPRTEPASRKSYVWRFA
jgi:hypothetical protein